MPGLSTGSERGEYHTRRNALIAQDVNRSNADRDARERERMTNTRERVAGARQMATQLRQRGTRLPDEPR